MNAGPHARGPTARYRFAFPSTTAAFRLSPVSFARFIGDVRNAPLNAS